jgi:hypothetical protein
VTKTAIVCIALFLFCPRANAQASATILPAPFICEWANIQGGCLGMGWQAGFPTPSSPVDANCGPTSVLMLASKYSGATPAADQISQMDDWLQLMFATSWFYMVNNGKGSGTEPPELTSLARNFFGLSNSNSFSGWTLGQLRQELAQGFPVIVRVRPQMVANYPDAHYMVLLGMDDQFVYVNDPGRGLGADRKYKLQDFIASWARTASWDGKNNEGITIHSSSPSMNDNFNENFLNSSLWTTLSPPPTSTVTVAVTNQQLQVAMGPGAGGGGVLSNCSLSGDFDAQVDYILLNWSANNTHSVRLGARDLGTGLGMNRSSFSSELYVFFAGTTAVVPTSDTAGKLRLVRTGSTLSGFFFNGTSWVLVGSAVTSTGPTHFNLDLGTGNPSAPGVSIAFDNFQVNAGTISCPGGP